MSYLRLIFAGKKFTIQRENVCWCGVTSVWNYFHFSRKPKMDENADPNESLMTLMKQMYEDGDDEMKRTIAKAWTESRDKNPGMM